MTPEEIEKLAMRDADIPSGVDLPEMLLFLSLRMVYKTFRAGHIDREKARAEKNVVLREYGALEINYRAWETSEKRLKEIRKNAVVMEKSDCEMCRKTIRITDGRDNVCRG